MKKQYDLVVLGSGTAGGTIAANCRAAGWSVALVEPLPLGGTCALRGCEPKKVFWTLAEALDRTRKLAEVGLSGGAETSLDWSTVQRFKHSFTDPVPEHNAEDYRRSGVDVYRGAGQFTGPDTILASDAVLEFRHAVIAIGARSTPLGIPGADLLGNSDTFLDLDQLPAHLTLIGGGYIGFEFAHMARRGGAEVTILHDNDQPLAQFDHSMVKKLLAATRALGIRVELSVEVTGITRNDAGFTIAVRRQGQEFTLATGLALQTAGRAPDLDSLSLATAGIKLEGKKLQLDEMLRTTNPAVFAAGDAAGKGPALTPVASLEAVAVTASLLGSGEKKPNYRGIPSVVFTIPPLTAVGMTEEAAIAAGLDYECHEGSMAGFQTMRRLRRKQQPIVYWWSGDRAGY